MDWEQLTIIAQIVTGIATLAVAVFLASQLSQQHRDSQKDIVMRIQDRADTYRVEMFKDPKLATLWNRGQSSYSTLSDEEKEQFGWLCLGLTTIWMNMSEYIDEVGIETETIFKNMLEGEGMRARLADEKGMRPVLPAKFVAYLDEISGEMGRPLPQA